MSKALREPRKQRYSVKSKSILLRRQAFSSLTRKPLRVANQPTQDASQQAKSP